MSVRRESGGTLDEAVIGSGRVGMCSRTSVVECSKDARWAALLYEVAHDLVVEVLDRCPLDLLADVLLLLALQGKLDEDLLQLLIDIVDAKLLERVVLRLFEYVNDPNRKQVSRMISPQRFRNRRCPDMHHC